MKTARISIIAAIGKNRELGKQGDLVWRLSADLKRVKQLTTGHPIIMGRKTYDSIGRPLPERTNIVLSSTVHDIPGCTVCSDLEKALEFARDIDQEEAFIFGGAAVYEEALPMATRLYLTVVDATDNEADTFFPPYEAFDHVVSSESGQEGDLEFTYLILEKN